MDRWIPILQLGFKGERFSGGALDVEAMPELAVYHALVTHVAEDLWRQAHPDAQRLKKGFSKKFRMRCTGFTDGSTVAHLERTASTALPFAEENDIFDRAMRVVDGVLQAANEGSNLPPDFSRSLLPQFRAWGRTLGEGEFFELRSPDRSLRSTYTPATRAHLLQLIDTAYEDVADVTGHVLATSIRQGKFELYPDIESANGIDVPLSPEHEQIVIAALSAYQEAQLRVTGRVAYTADGHPVRFVAVDRVEPWDVAAEVDNAPLWAVIANISRRVPDDIWARLPTDGARRLDHYLLSE